MRVTPDTLKQFGGERNAALASQVSSPSPFFYTHPVVKILAQHREDFINEIGRAVLADARDELKREGRERAEAREWTGSLEEELETEWFRDAESDQENS